MLRILLTLLLLLLSAPAAAQNCDERPVRIVSETFFSETLNRDLSYSVYIPACLDERMTEGYPVLYLLHGQDMDESVWQEMGLDEAIRAGLAAGELPLFYTVVPREENYLDSLFLSAFEDAVIAELIPRVDETLNTCTSRDCRAIGGISRGALWAEKIAFDHPALFASLGLHSMPGTVYDDQVLYFLTQDQSPEEFLRIRMDSGREDNYRHESIRASQQLNFIGYEHEYVLRPGGHDPDYWRARLPESLKWYAEKW